MSEIYDAFEHGTQWRNPLGKGQGVDNPGRGAHGRQTPPTRISQPKWRFWPRRSACVSRLGLTFCARRRGPGKRRKCGSRRRGHRDRGSNLHYSYKKRTIISDSVSISGDAPVASSPPVWTLDSDPPRSRSMWGMQRRDCCSVCYLR